MYEILRNAIDDVTLRRIKAMSESLWERQGSVPDIQKWLTHFDGRTGTHSADVERHHAAHLLSHFTYFGRAEVEALLVALYRDLFRYRVIQEIRDQAKGAYDAKLFQESFKRELDATRFFGVGGPSESGPMLLYAFRQQNRLDETLFPDPYSILALSQDAGGEVLSDPTIKRLVFIDDLLGTGTQATRYSSTVVERVRRAAQTCGQKVQVWYLTLFATQDGLATAQELNFDWVSAVHELSASQRAFSDQSHAYADPPPGISKQAGLEIANRYGIDVAPGDPLGMGGSQLLLGFSHNIPDNTLPIFWASNTVVPWRPIFRRFSKDPEA